MTSSSSSAKSTAIPSLSSEAELTSALTSSPALVLFFTCPNYGPCDQMSSVCIALQSQHPNIPFRSIDIEATTLADRWSQVDSVPAFLLFHREKIVDFLQGANPVELKNKVKALESINAMATQVGTPMGEDKKAKEGQNNTETLHSRLDKLINASPVMLFLKGAPDAPRCGFSKKMVALLDEAGIIYGHFDILTDNTVREGLKTYKNWPTYPQLYVGGELIGGIDVVRELNEAGELKPQIPKNSLKSSGTSTSLEDKLKSLINQSPVMLFMKGTPDAPQCGFSNSAVEVLKGVGCEFGHFNILSDENVREGLKKFSNWPTYPQLYVKGELIGGLDIMKELNDAGELKEKIHEASA